uniref:hypothetical protein n=1 Tax=Okeania sp. SIO2F4 TaxID=2607790 RepID=UPI0025ED1CF2|nr:hypothetical protein [Okeania sp. SIO2F4]
MAEKSGSFHVDLDQFAYINNLFLAVCYQQSSDEQLQNYEQEVVENGRMSRGLSKIFKFV